MGIYWVKRNNVISCIMGNVGSFLEFRPYRGKNQDISASAASSFYVLFFSLPPQLCGSAVLNCRNNPLTTFYRLPVSQ